jgi:FkbM family methyltransferase
MNWIILLVTLALLALAGRALLRRRRKHTFKEYGFGIRHFTLGEDGELEYAQWLHPRERDKDFSQGQIDALREYVADGDLVVDIGAHTGDTTVPLAFAAGVNGTTIAIEPNPYVYKILEENVKLNSAKTNIVPFCIAATETDGSFTFQYSDAAFCNGGYLASIENQRHRHNFPLEVEGRNVEALLRGQFADKLARLSYIKIDTEGYDKAVIRSIMGILKEFRPVIVAEVLKKLSADERFELYDLLQEAGYEPYLHADSGPFKGQHIARDQMSDWAHFDILAIPGENVADADAA